MAATKSFENGLMEVEKNLEEIFTRFQKCCTQVRQEFSLRSDQYNKITDCFKESVKEDSSKTEGNPTISEEGGTDSLRKQGEDDWQPASKNDLQNIHNTLDCLVQGLGSNYKSSGLEFHSITILVLHLESNSLYGLLFGQRMTWDPGIRVIKILKQHLKDKVVSILGLKKELFIKKTFGDLEGMAATKNFEDGLMEVEEKLEEIFMRFQKCCTQVHQEFSLQSDKVFKSVEAAKKKKKNKLIHAAVKEKKNRERQQNQCYKRRMDAKLFWKKFAVASQPTKKLWISLGKRVVEAATGEKRRRDWAGKRNVSRRLVSRVVEAATGEKRRRDWAGKRNVSRRLVSRFERSNGERRNV
nr:hypothetical protein [Tanacetum cinerariifolium]